MLGEKLITAAAGNVGAAGGVLGVEDVFSTWLYTGNGSTQTITNGIDLDGEGGLVAIKIRSSSNFGTAFIDTARGGSGRLFSSSSAADDNNGNLTFSGTGFSLTSGNGVTNDTSQTYASWTFRKAEKFFDVVTYTGTGSAQNINHNLGSVPGVIITKKISSTSNWAVYHRGVPAGGHTGALLLNAPDAFATASTVWDNTPPTSTTFRVGTADATNINGATYVAYLFAHDAGGFGDDGTESVIKCGSTTVDSGGNATVDLGWEPQWLLIKNSQAAGYDWVLADNMRGIFTNASSTMQSLLANTSGAETTASYCQLTSTGFKITGGFGGSQTVVYIAIRRGPMKTPTDATTVFKDAIETPSGSSDYVLNSSSGFPVDFILSKQRTNSLSSFTTSRLTNNYLQTALTDAEGTYTYGFDLMQGVRAQWSAASVVSYAFRRAPGFFDVVAYTGTGVARTVAHNLGVAPELMIVKRRNLAEGWQVYSGPTEPDNCLELNATTQAIDRTGTSERWSSAPTSTDINLATHVSVNGSGSTYVAFLFASCPGVSKVGSYTGSAGSLHINCDFTSGARFVMIKRTDSSGDWYFWDTARGIVTGNDPYLLLNSFAAEVTSTDYIDPISSGFQISSSAPAAINASGGSYIFLAIA